jgi:hypothetical protein
VTEQLVADVIAAGGCIRLPRRWSNPNGIDYERRAQLAQLHGKVPEGKWLTVSSVSGDELEIRLMEVRGHRVESRGSVPVAKHVSRYHPIVRELRQQEDRCEVSRAQLSRMMRIIHGLITEAERRGYDVGVTPETKDPYGRQAWSARDDGHFVVIVDGNECAVRAREEGVRAPSLWAAYSWHRGELRRVPLDESSATGRLSLELVGNAPRSGRIARWADRRSWTLEEKLPEVLWEIEIRAIERRLQQEAAQREAAEREAAWHAALERARHLYSDHCRAQALRRQIDDWRMAVDIRSYCAAMRGAYPDDIEIGRWIEWASGYADALDPLRTGPRAPAVIDEPTREELKPFLDGWSPYEPVRRGSFR